jgi:uncharacterized glyoxalase superfamily protein PhnB
MKLPPFVPEIPVHDIDEAVAYYCEAFGFTLDWRYKGELAGLSRGLARVFLKTVHEGSGPAVVWINLESVRLVDSLYAEWQKSGVSLLGTPEEKSWGLYEFSAEDNDGNRFRAFHDLGTAAQIPRS